MPHAALAQTPSIDPELRAEGERLQAEALAHVDAERWGLAAETYERVYEIARRAGSPRAPVALWDRGLALMRIPGREADARASFQRFLDESTPLTEDAEIRDWRSTALEHIAELNARIGPEQDEPEPVRPSEAEPSESREGPRAGELSPVGPVVLAAGIAALGVGGVFGALALTAESSLAERCGGFACVDTPQHRAAYDEMRTFGAVTDAMLVVGGLAAITGAILTFTLTEGGSAETTASAALRPDGAELAIGGSF